MPNINTKNNTISNGVNKITWVNLLHFYQPPTAESEVVIEAADKCYKRIISALKRNPNIKFTINISGCLLEKLERLNYHELIRDIRALAERGQIELTGTAACHPILPLLPEAEIIRSIKANEEIIKKYFGNVELKGFFPPEAAYSKIVAKIIKQQGYEWLMLDEIAATGKLENLQSDKLYVNDDSGIKLCFRSREDSKSYVPKIIFDYINSGKEKIVVTATDAELYGLRHTDFTATFEKLLKRPELKTATVSEYLSKLKDKKKIKPVASSWESSEKELKKKLPYALWQNKKNKIQSLIWELADLAITAVKKNETDEQYDWARLHLDRGLSSCTFWWASGRDFKLFGSISWNPDEIERGINELIRSIRSLSNPATKNTKIKAEKLYIKIKKLIWHKHWTYYWRNV